MCACVPRQVLSTSSPSSASTADLAALPDDLPGQSNTAAAAAAAGGRRGWPGPIRSRGAV